MMLAMHSMFENVFHRTALQDAGGLATGGAAAFNDSVNR
jgi:hypothetical protein